jgi:hypothetical protein
MSAWIGRTPTESLGGALKETPGRALQVAGPQRHRVFRMTNLAPMPYDTMTTPHVPIVTNPQPDVWMALENWQTLPLFKFQCALGDPQHNYPDLVATVNPPGTIAFPGWGEMYDNTTPVVLRTKMSAGFAAFFKHSILVAGIPTKVPVFATGEDGFIFLDILSSNDDDGWTFQVMNLGKKVPGLGWVFVDNPVLSVFSCYGICSVASNHFIGDRSITYHTSAGEGCSIQVYNELLPAKVSLHGYAVGFLDSAYLTVPLPNKGALPTNVPAGEILPSFAQTVSPLWIRNGAFANAGPVYAKKALVIWRANNRNLPVVPFDPTNPDLGLLIVAD